jgi:hypothetical protein
LAKAGNLYNNNPLTEVNGNDFLLLIIFKNEKRVVILSIAKDLFQEPITTARYGVEDPSLCSG